MYFFRKGKRSPAESRQSQGPFKGPCKAQKRTMTGHGPPRMIKDSETPVWLG